jgi:Lon protease-like protein
MELPTFIPLFPLPNVVLFPEVPLPLHIFEARYREMVRDALASARLIGMTLLRPNWERDYEAAPEVYRVGCAGRIVDATPLPGGRFNIVLAGLREFEILSEQRERSYRQATVAWRAPVTETALPPVVRASVLHAAEQHVGSEGRKLIAELTGDQELGDVTLVNFLAFWLDLRPVEKQALLEAEGVDRARRLLEILEFQRHDAQAGLAAPGSRRMH